MDEKEFKRLMFDTLTPYYQIISLMFLSMGFVLSILSIVGIIDISYLVPGVLSVVFGIIFIIFLLSLKREKDK